MKLMLIAFLNGLAQAAVFALLARLAGRRHRLWMYAALLVVAAGVYVGFAARAGAWGGAAVEVAGTVAFGAVALVGVRRRSARLVALGWALHPVWDVALHSVGTMAEYTPGGWVVACIGFDLLLAALLARGWSPAPAPDPAAAA